LHSQNGNSHGQERAAYRVEREANSDHVADMHNAATNRDNVCAIDTNLKMTPLGSREPKKSPQLAPRGDGGMVEEIY